MIRRRRSLRARRRRAMALVVVLVAIAMLSLAALTFSQSMFAEREAAWVHGRAAQSRMAAESGVELALVSLMLDDAGRIDAGGLFDNPGRFRGVVVHDDALPRERRLLSLVAPAIAADGRY